MYAPRKHCRFLNYLREAYASDGTKNWPSKTAEWFVVRLITKVLIVPHGLHSGSTIPNMQKAYLPLVRDLVCKLTNTLSANLMRQLVEL